MQASAIEFRLRVPIMVAIVMLGFFAPWLGFSDLGMRVPLLAWLPLEASRMGLLRFAYATPTVILLGALISAAGMILRVWGAAYLGYGTVHHGQMVAWEVMADGPYRFMRNPLYLGGWCMMLAIALLMPPSGALVSMVLLTVFYLRLILGEEAFLCATLGEPYKEYLRETPRLLPRLRAGLLAFGNKPHWLTAALTELNPIGVFITLAVLSWFYNYELLLKAILVSFGLSLVVRALMPRGRAKANPA
jgi:protein-S-isoprenylcysteine O-methyltransferase Ste14